VGQVQKGQTATFTVDAYPNRVFQARITQTRYNSETVDGVVTYKTILKVQNQDLYLRPGMTATADITVKRIEKAILIPNTALRFTPPIQDSGKTPSSGGLVGAILPRMPRMAPRKSPPAVAEADKTQRRIWTLRNGQPAALDISVGVTDGTRTEVLKGDIRPGTELVTDTVTPRK